MSDELDIVALGEPLFELSQPPGTTHYEQGFGGDTSNVVVAAARQGARVGTSSLRRQAQVRHMRPDLDVRDLRGNVDTRLRKAESGEYDAILLSKAGLDRLGLSQRIGDVCSFALDVGHLRPAHLILSDDFLLQRESVFKIEMGVLTLFAKCRVADARKHVCEGIGHHGFTSSPSSRRGAHP